MIRPWYKIEASGTEVADVSIHGDIGEGGVSAKEFLADLAKIKASHIKVSINSPGGDVFEAITIYTALRASGKRVTTSVLGIAASAAAYIMLAGDHRTMPENTMQMVHNASTGIYGNADEITEIADVLRKVDETLHATYATRTGMTRAQVADLLSKDTYLTAAEYLELGLCDEVTEAVKLSASAKTLDRLPAKVRAMFTAEAVFPNSNAAPISKYKVALDPRIEYDEQIAFAVALGLDVRRVDEGGSTKYEAYGPLVNLYALTSTLRGAIYSAYLVKNNIALGDLLELDFGRAPTSEERRAAAAFVQFCSGAGATAKATLRESQAKVVRVELPPRVTDTTVIRNQDGEIKSTRAVERDEIVKQAVQRGL